MSVIQTHIILYFHHYVQEIKQQERIKICTLSRQISSVRPCFKDIRWFRSFIQKSNDKEKSLLKIVSLRLLSTMNFRRSKCIRIFRWFKSHLDNFILNTLNCVTFIWILLNKLLHDEVCQILIYYVLVKKQSLKWYLKQLLSSFFKKSSHFHNKVENEFELFSIIIGYSIQFRVFYTIYWIYFYEQTN